MSREQHNESVAFAQAEIQALENRFLAAKEKQGECLAAVVQATGGAECEAESGRMAFEWTAMLADRIEELVRFTDNIHAELNRYAGGF